MSVYGHNRMSQHPRPCDSVLSNVPFGEVGDEAGFFTQAGGIHGADFAIDGAFLKGMVVFAKAPGDSGIAVGVASVEGVFVVEVKGSLEAFLGAFRPFEEFFTPIHAHVIVHFACFHHFQLGCIPVGIVGLGGLPVVGGIDIGSRVGLVLIEGIFSPFG